MTILEGGAEVVCPGCEAVLYRVKGGRILVAGMDICCSVFEPAQEGVPEPYPGMEGLCPLCLNDGLREPYLASGHLAGGFGIRIHTRNGWWPPDEREESAALHPGPPPGDPAPGKESSR